MACSRKLVLHRCRISHHLAATTQILLHEKLIHQSDSTMTQLPTASMIGDEEADIKMNFNFDVVDDVRAKVEALVQKSTLGRFDGAREIIDSIVDGPEGEDFVIAFEVLRLLYDQGQFQQLREVIEKLSRRRPLPTSESTMPSEAWSVKESDVLKLMDMVALVSMDCNKRFGFREPLKKPPQASISQRLRNLRLKALDDEDVSSSPTLGPMNTA